MEFTRRDFLMRAAATAGALSFGASAAACASGDDASETVSRSTTTARNTRPTTTTKPLPTGVIADADVPDADTIFGWIDEVFSQGVRRPGYPADEWAEGWIADHFRRLELENVRLEPITVTRWEPREWSLEVTTATGERRELDCYPVPNAAPTDREGLELELAAFDSANAAAVQGKASLYEVALLRIPADLLASAGSAPADTSDRIIDPDGTLRGAEHVIPFGADFQEVMEPSVDAGAAAFIGTLTGYPGDSYKYFVPYDAIARPIPGVWVSGSDGAWLREQLAAGTVRVRLHVDVDTEEVESHNVVGELPGPNADRGDGDDDVVMIGSHHDGPWSSAVEDGSGIALVLAQATYWAAQPVERRPHRLVFVLQGGHMSGGAGLHGYIERHRAELDQVALEVHLEHAAREFAERDGRLEPTGEPVPRWWFTSRIAPLEQAVGDALREEQLGRSMVLAPDAFGDQPPTDGGFYHRAGVPIVNFLAAPFYLFDEMDTLDKIDRDHLVALTRATIRIVDWTREVTAEALRRA
jgi:hypothetical protein